MEEREDGSIPSFQDKLLTFVKNNFLIVGLLSLGVILIGIGLIQMTAATGAEVKFEKGAEVAGAETSQNTTIKVDVEGEVIKPGVYELESDARVQDGLIAAGGLSSHADRNALNLAAKLADGMKIYVPAVGEEMSTTSIMGITSTTGEIQGGLISINSGSQSQLEELPGIGPVTALKIINARPYGSIEELVSKKAVGEKTFEKIRDLITL